MLKIGAAAGGRSYVAIPGPSPVPDRVLAAMQKAAPDIYAPEMEDLAIGIVRDLKALAGCSGHLAMYLGNGHAAWEAAASNVFSPGDRCLVLVTGRFGHGWTAVMKGLGIEAEVLDFGMHAPVDFARVAEVLDADTAHGYRAVAMVHTDTSTSIRNDVAQLRRVLDEAGHPALMLVDGVCSFGCDPFDMDSLGADVFVSACQKGLMTPAGMCFVFFSDRALRDCAGSRCRTCYWDWTARANPSEVYEYWYGTAPTHGLYGLRTALDIIGEEGREQVWARHARIAGAWWAAFDRWGEAGAMRMNVTDPALRSHAVTAARCTAPDATRLRDWVRDNAGLVLGVGLGMAPLGSPESHGFFRAGHMGHVNPLMALGAITSVEAGMKALGIAHASGGAEAAAAAIAAAVGPG